MFKRADVLRLLPTAIEGSAHRLDYLIRLGVVVPLKEADGRGDHRMFSVENIVEALYASELAANGFEPKQILIIFEKLREGLRTVRPALRASALFERYVEAIEALVALNGQAENYDAWRREVMPIVRQWRRRSKPVDNEILDMLTRRAERDAEDVHVVVA